MSKRRAEKERLLQEDNKDRSPLDEGYWNGLGEHTRLNTKKEETGWSEVVEITFTKDIEQPPAMEKVKTAMPLRMGQNPLRYGQEELG